MLEWPYIVHHATVGSLIPRGYLEYCEVSGLRQLILG